MDRDRRLAEMMGIKGWYCFVCERQLLPEEVTYVERCSICNTVLHDPDFSTPEWRAKLMDWATEQEWWDGFVEKQKSIFLGKWVRGEIDGKPWVNPESEFITYLWRNLATLIVEYHGEEGKWVIILLTTHTL